MLALLTSLFVGPSTALADDPEIVVLPRIPGGQPASDSIGDWIRTFAGCIVSPEDGDTFALGAHTVPDWGVSAFEEVGTTPAEWMWQLAGAERIRNAHGEGVTIAIMDSG